MDSVVYLPPPVVCERLQTIAERGLGECSQPTEETRMDYKLPVHASTEVRDFFRVTSSMVLSGDFIARLPGGRVFGSGAILSADGKSIARDVSVDFGKPFQQHWLLGYQKIRPPVFVPGTSRVVATALGGGYAHWLLEELPRLLVSLGEKCDITIAHRRSFNAEVLDRVGLTTKLLEPRRYSHFQSEHLIVPSLIGQPGYPTPRVGEILEEFAASYARPTSAGGERIYVSREKARRRRLMNESEVWPWLSVRGFERVFAEELTLAEQITVFRRAQVIVAPHGAGLANIVFCRPGTRIIELFNRSYVNGCYWRMASIRGLDYRPIVSPGDGPLNAELSSNSVDMKIDVERLAGAVVDP